MHDQSASRISGRTRAAVSAMCVRAVGITVLKSAGNFTRGECHDLNAEKVQRVKCFVFTRCGVWCVPAIFERRRGRLGSKISGCGQLAEAASLRHVRSTHGSTNRVGMSAAAVADDAVYCPNSFVSSPMPSIANVISFAHFAVQFRFETVGIFKVHRHLVAVEGQ
jgi:hypothetical protein